MGRSENDSGGGAGLECLFPSCHAETPAVAGLQAREIRFRDRRRQVVALPPREIQEYVRHFRADGMEAGVVRAGTAIAVAIKTCDGIPAARLQFSSEDVGRHVS